MRKLKIGDSVKCIANDNGSGEYIGMEGSVISVGSCEYKYRYSVSFCSAGFSDEELKLTKNYMNTKEKFALIFKGEPEKSLRKAGLTNGDDLATEEGVQLYVSYLMKKDKTFLDEVVVPILKEEESK